jgi:carbonic anhydrase
MQRRSFIKHASAALCLCGTCSPVLANEAGGKHWEYGGENGPEKWADLSPEYAACRLGKEQSPINLRAAIPAALPDPAVAWKPIPLKVINNGHTIQVDGAGGGSLILDGVAYDLLQFHFHHPSEHVVDGIPAPMEVHFVHKSSDGMLAVLGAMIVEGPPNPVLESIWSIMPVHAGDTANGSGNLDIRSLLPVDPITYRYAGSLTTPPCSEVVQWAVFRKPITASFSQLSLFSKLFPNNARPIQPLGRRKLLLDTL